MSELNKRLAGLSPEKRALLMQQLSKKKSANPTIKIGGRERPERLPLSYTQQRLWIIDQLSVNSSTYNLFEASWLKGKLDIALLKCALTELVRRHEILRSVICNDDKGPFQKFTPSTKVTLKLINLCDVPEQHKRIKAKELAHQEISTPFILSEGQLFRPTLIQLSEQESLFILNAHHIVTDGWSFGVLFSELRSIYKAYLNGQPSPLAEPQLQYIDYALWQREVLSKESKLMKKQLAYWEEQLSGELPTLDLPSDRPRPLVQSNKGDTYGFKISKSLYHSLSSFAQSKGATNFMVFTAVLQSLLARYTGQQDLTLGLGIANRQRQELEPLVGFFVNTLIMRNDLTGDPSFLQIVKRVKETTLDAYDNQDLPMELLLESLKLERSLSHSPLSQVMLFFQNFPSDSINLGDAVMTPLELGEINAGVARTDLAFFVEEEKESLSIFIEYATDLFDKERIVALAKGFEQLMSSVLSAPNLLLSEFDIIPSDDKNKLLIDWNNTQREVPQDLCIHTLVEKQVASTPNAIAAQYLGKSITYSQLDIEAKNVAKELVFQGVKSGDKVGLCTSRSHKLLVAILAILKTGAAYVPIDPNHPEARVNAMLDDADIALVLTESDLEYKLLSNKINTVLLDKIQSNEERETELPANVSDSSCAYVIFTSGTTGRPKGVMVSHKSVVNFLHSMANKPGISSEDTLCAVTTLSFDISVLELLLPLTVGAKIEIADSTVVSDGFALAKLLESAGATMMQATPSTWRMLIESGWKGNSGFKLLSGGEPLSVDLAQQLLGNTKEVWNLYGPTETTIWSSLTRIEENEDLMTVGHPIDNTQIYILDNNDKLAAIGVTGELVIGGEGVSMGYLKRPELTKEKYIANPWSNLTKSRLYRTGDLARWGLDGRLEILGRIDQQVKLRGYRIELGEIEAVLNTISYVSQAIVMCREDVANDKRLVAYLLSDTGITQQDIDEELLNRELSTKLPEYMLPSAYVLLDELPVTLNGKLDKSKLPAPQLIRLEKSVPPRNEEEQILAQLWADVLGIEEVGVHDNFFKLGGHSLSAAQLIVKIQNTTGSELTLRALFEAPTIAGFGELISKERLQNVDDDVLSGMLAQLEGLSAEEMDSLLALEGAK